MGQRPGIAEALLLQARIAATRGDYMEACGLYQESVAFCREKGDQWNIAMNLEGIACVVVIQGEQRWAAHLLGAAEALRESIGGPLPLIYRAEYEQAVEAVRTQLGEKAFIAAWTKGRTMTPKEALAARIPMTKAPLEEAVPVLTRKSTRAYPAGLTRREGEILRLVAQGLTNEQVAEQLVISPRTVDTHLTSIYSKIEVSSRSGATLYAAQHHLV